MTTRLVHLVRWTSRGYLIAVIAAGAYSWWVATTTPFTLGGDVATAVPLGVLSAVASAQWWADHHGPALPHLLARLDPPSPSTGAAWPVPAVLTGLFGWELYNFFSAPRTEHPTISSLYDAASRTHAWKAAFVLAWLALGWELVRR